MVVSVRGSVVVGQVDHLRYLESLIGVRVGHDTAAPGETIDTITASLHPSSHTPRRHRTDTPSAGSLDG